jgi:predicted MFS family arabinose efflux permease
MTAAASAFGWRTAGFVAALIGFAALSGLWWKRDELSNALGGVSRDAAKRARGSDVTIGGLLKLPLVWFAFSFFFLSTLVLAALQNFAPSLVRDLFGLSLTAGTSALTAYLIGGAAGVAMGGFLTGDNKNEERIVGLAFLASAVLALVLAFSFTPAWAVIGVMALMGCGVGLAGPSRDMLVRKCAATRLGTGAFGRIYGLVYSGLDVGLAAGPLIFGMMMDAGKPRLVFIGIGLSFVLATIAAQAMAREVKGSA